MGERITLLITGGGARLRSSLRLMFGIHCVLRYADNGLLSFMAGGQANRQKRGNRCDLSSL